MNKTKITIILALLGLVFLMSGSIAYFVKIVNGTITGNTGQVILNVTGYTDDVNKVITFGKIKPGDEGELTLNINATGTEMDIIYTIDIERTNLPDNMKFYYDRFHKDHFVNHSVFMEQSDSMTEAVTIYWYWIENADNASDNLFQNTTISAEVNVTAEQQVYGTMKNGAIELTEFWSDAYSTSIRNIYFSRDLSEMPELCTEETLCWDISEVGSNYPVYAYMIDNDEIMVDDPETPEYYKNLYIVCEKEIYAPTNCYNLFGEFEECETINFNNNFNTAKVTSMRAMFSPGASNIGLISNEFNRPKIETMGIILVPSAAASCALEYVDLTGFITTNVTDMEGMFFGCTYLTRIDASSFNTSKVTSMSRMFAYCNDLTELNITSFSTVNVQTMENMFESCTSLEELNLQNFDTSNVVDMRYMFRNCSSLTSLNLNNFNTKNVETMNSMFENCLSLVELNVDHFDTSKVTNMQLMFNECSSLTTLDLSSFKTSNVASMWSMFNGCLNLVSIDLSNFNSRQVSNMSSMFQDCENLTRLDLSSMAIKSRNKQMFYNCRKLEYLDISKESSDQFDSDIFYNVGVDAPTITKVLVYNSTQQNKVIFNSEATELGWTTANVLIK